MGDKVGYIVRGAQMECNCGSHKRKINLPVSHGSYVKEKPMMNKTDSKPDNIPYFGICKSGKNPSSEIIHLISETDGGNNSTVRNIGGTISGKKCNPKILSTWDNTKEDTIVEKEEALTTKSQLICAYSGIIKFINDGQED